MAFGSWLASDVMTPAQKPGDPPPGGQMGWGVENAANQTKGVFAKAAASGAAASAGKGSGLKPTPGISGQPAAPRRPPVLVSERQQPQYASTTGAPRPGQTGTASNALYPTTEAPQGWDFTGPGVGEQFFQINEKSWTTPGQLENWYAQNQNALNAPTQAEQYYGQVNPMILDRANALSSDPGLTPYYANAKRRASESINSAAASRGTYGSSAALGQLGEAYTNLDAEQANREADYALKLAEAQRQWLGLGGQIAGQAGSQGQGRLGQAAGIAGAAQAAGLGRLGQGFNAATAAQESRRQRGQDYLNNVMGYGGAVGGVVGEGYKGIISGDRDLIDAAIAMDTGLGANYYGQAQNEGARDDQAVANDINLLKTFLAFGK